MGDRNRLDGKGARCRFEGRVPDTAGHPIEGALVGVWSGNDEGFCEVRPRGIQPAVTNRGIFRTGANGRYCFYEGKPVSCPISDNCPVGKLLHSLGRDPYRPAHADLRILAGGHRPRITHTSVAGDSHLASDAVFGVKDAHNVKFEPVGDGATGEGRAVQCDYILA